MSGYILYSQTDIEQIGIVELNNKIIHVYFDHDEPSSDYLKKETTLLLEAHKQLKEYLKGIRREFQLPLFPVGTSFMQDVWDALSTIPYGETRSYSDIAIAVGRDKATRAVGLANNRNPIPIFIPCHRVIGKNGKLVGYGGGLPVKEHLLELEKKYANR